MKFLPMLACKLEDVNVLKFPSLVSTKLDGIRCMAQGGQLVSRKLLPIANKRIQAALKELPEGLDGELIYGDSLAKDCFRQTTSAVMSEDGPLDGLLYYVFDYFDKEGFAQRLEKVQHIVNKFRTLPIRLVEHVMIEDAETLLKFEEVLLDQGAEGLMLRKPDGRYKQGRSTKNEGLLWKLKRFTDGECRVTGFEPLYRNHNAATTNLLGRTERSSHKAGKVADDLLGKLLVVDLESGISFDVGSGFDSEEREKYWQERNTLVGKIVKYRYFSVGMKDGKPRHPTFEGFRDERDMS